MANENLAKKINEEIAKIAAIADKLPGVVVIHDISDWKVVWMSDRGLKELGITKGEIIGKKMDEYHSLFFNADDAKDYAPKIIELLAKNHDGETLTFFQQVRFLGSAEWKWHMSSIKILMRNEDDQPVLTITMSFPIDAMHHMTSKASRLLEENNFLRRNFQEYARLSKREREILRLAALGKTSMEIADELFIAKNTVETHRKNIKKKLNANTFFELCQYARAFDLI